MDYRGIQSLIEILKQVFFNFENYSLDYFQCSVHKNQGVILIRSNILFCFQNAVYLQHNRNKVKK